MDDEPPLDCIVVATRTDRSSTMGPPSRQSATPNNGSRGSEVHNAPRGSSTGQNQTMTTPSSISRAALPSLRGTSDKQTAGPSTRKRDTGPFVTGEAPAKKHLPPASRIGYTASRFAASNSANERPPKRAHHEAFHAKSYQDFLQQPAPRGLKTPRGIEPQRNNKDTRADPEIISLSSDNDEDINSDEELLPAIRKRRLNGDGSHPPRHQQQMQEPQLGNTIAYPVAFIAQSQPSSRQVFNTSPNSRADTRDVVVDPKRTPAATDTLEKDRDARVTISQLEKERQALRLELSQRKIDKESLTKQLSKAKAMTENAFKGKVAKNEEVLKLRDILSTREGQINNLRQLLDEASQNQVDAVARITKLEALNGELKEKNSHMEEQYDQLQQQSANQALAEGATKRQAEELKKQVSSQSDEIREYKKQVSSQSDEIREYQGRVADLREEVAWYEGLRERMIKEWDERVAMEMKWRDSLLALDTGMSLAERKRDALAAVDPIQSAAEQQSAQGQSAERDVSQGALSSGGSSRAC